MLRDLTIAVPCVALAAAGAAPRPGRGLYADDRPGTVMAGANTPEADTPEADTGGVSILGVVDAEMAECRPSAAPACGSAGRGRGL